MDLAAKSKDSYTTNTSLRRLPSELNAMTHCLAAANPRTFQDFHNRRLDGQAGPVSSDLSEAFYLEVLGLAPAKPDAPLATGGAIAAPIAREVMQALLQPGGGSTAVESSRAPTPGANRKGGAAGVRSGGPGTSCASCAAPACRAAQSARSCCATPRPGGRGRSSLGPGDAPHS